MITYEVKKYEADNSIFSFMGLSDDDKPQGTFQGETIANGSTFFEMDTQNVYFYDGDDGEWLAQP